MDVPKALVLAILASTILFINGDVQGAVNTLLIGIGIQKGGDALGPLTSLLVKK